MRSQANVKMIAGFGKQVLWNGLDGAGRCVSSGVYFNRLERDDRRATRKMVVMR